MKHLKLFLVVTLCCLYGFSAFAQPENLYIIGGPFNANKPNWIFRDIVQLEKDAINPSIFYYNGYIGYNTFGDEPGNFKILTANNSWDNGYHPEGTANVQIGAAQVGTPLAMRLGGDDTKWFIPEDRSGDGYYKIKIDTQDNTFLIESFTPASCPEYPVGLFIIGGPFIVDVDGWSVDESIKLERDATNPYLFHYKGYMERNQWGNEPGNFKILINARSWEDSFHPEGTSEVSLPSLIGSVSNIRRGGADTKWYLPEDGTGNGYWDFTFDTQDNTLTINSFIHDLDYFENVYITGDAMPSGWTNSTPETMTKTERGIYTWTGTLKAGEFKFLKYLNNWNSGYLAETDREPVVLNTDLNVIYLKNYNKFGNDYKFLVDAALDNKEVQIVLDLNTKTMKVTSVYTNTVNSKNETIKISSSNSNILVNGLDNENLILNVYSIEGKQVVNRAFSGSTAVSLQKGSYLVLISNQTGLMIREKVLIY